MSLLSICSWLETTAVALVVRESAYGFAVLAGLHILALTVSVGIVIWFDLRLLGLSMPSCPVQQVYRRLMPLMVCGFAVMFVTGALLFTGFATKAYGNPYFRLKLIGLFVAGANAAYFHFATERGIAEWNTARRLPSLARLAGVVSIVVWALVILAGRMMSYTMF
jgi:hypothetical protein